MTEQIHVWRVAHGVVVEVRASRPLTVSDYDMLARYVELARECESDDTLATPKEPHD